MQSAEGESVVPVTVWLVKLDEDIVQHVRNRSFGDLGYLTVSLAGHLC